MATNPDTLTAVGKITRCRKPLAASRTPYSRPPSNSPARNPNWMSNLIYPVKVIASAATNVFSFFGNDSLSSSDDEFEDDDDEVPEVGNDGSNKVFSPASKSDSKHKIDQLVMKETFSREEGEELLKLIKSRIMDSNVNFGTSPAKKTAIMEARKWLQEKRSASEKTLEAELDLTSSKHTEKEHGSPADMAKSYMQNRPTWSSPSSKQVEFGSPSTLGMLHFKEETPTSTLRSSELKRSSVASESWTLLDEIRRVRAKATEDLLVATPVMKTSLSISSPENNQNILEKKGIAELAGLAAGTYGAQDQVLNDAATSSAKDNQDANAFQSVELQERPEAVDVPVLNSVKDIEVIELRSAKPENDFVAFGHVKGQIVADELRPSVEENGILIVGSSLGGDDVHVEDPNLVTEHNQITTAEETILNPSQNSSSMQEEDPSQDFSHPTVDGHTSKANDPQKEIKLRVHPKRPRKGK